MPPEWGGEPPAGGEDDAFVLLAKKVAGLALARRDVVAAQRRNIDDLKPTVGAYIQIDF